VKILPYITFEVTSADPTDVVVQRLSKAVDRAWWSANLPYIGDVWDAGFKVTPVTWYNNSFKPVITGKFEPAPAGGTVIHVTMRMNIFVTVFMSLWLAGAFFGLGASIFVVIIGNVSWPGILIPLGILSVGAGMALGGFWYEVPQRREDITSVLLGPGVPSLARATC
jgi:hypothetical protein